MKKSISIILVLLMLLSVFAIAPFSADAADSSANPTGVIASGTTGTANWQLTDSGELKISGTNAVMNDYYDEATNYDTGEAPWRIYKDDIKSITISKGVKHIGAAAFDDLNKVTSVYIGDAEDIGGCAFCHCKSLEKVTIPKSVKVIKKYAFEYCSSLKTINLSTGLETVGNYAFGDIDADSVYIPNTVTSIGYRSFGYVYNNATHNDEPKDGFKIYTGSAAAKSYAIENGFNYVNRKNGSCGSGVNYELNFDTSVLTISGSGKMTEYSDYIEDRYQPWNYFKDAITKVEVTGTIDSIGSAAFRFCRNLTEVELGTVTDIGVQSFFGCESLTSIDLKNVENVKSEAFCECKSLAEVNTDSRKLKTLGTDAFCDTAVRSIYLPDTINTISDHAVGYNLSGGKYGPSFSDFTIITEYDSFVAQWAQPADGARWFKLQYTTDSGTSGECSYFMDFETGTLTIRKGALVINGSGRMSEYELNATPWSGYADNIKKVVIETGVTQIGKYAFNGLLGLTEIETPSTTKLIREDAFSYCVNVEKIVINGTDCVVEKNAFENCEIKEMSEITLNGIKSIGEYGFYECDSKVLNLGEVETIGDSAFALNETVTKVIIPETCTSIGAFAFSGCAKLKKITFLNPDTVISDEANTIYPSTVICGYKGSTAEAFATANGRTFVDLDDDPGDDPEEPDIKTDISDYTVKGIKNKTYTGKALTQEIAVYDVDGYKISDSNYTVTYKNNTNAGKATVIIKGIGGNTGTIKRTFTIAKAKNPMTVSAKKSVTAKASKKTTVKKAVTVKNAKGKVTYKTSNKKVTIKKGIMTIAKGLKKGKTYKVKVTVTAKGDSNYKSGKLVKTIKVNVK